jgi:hypothetical protein
MRPAILASTLCLVHRTQISLGDEELELLDIAAQATGAARAELIRRAVRKHYGGLAAYANRTPEERLANIRKARGIWADRPFTGEEYVRAIRSGGDMNANLRRIGAID